MSEDAPLQNESADPVTTEPAVIENPDNGAELAPDSEAKHEEKTQVELDTEKQVKFDKAFGDQYGKANTAERNADALQKSVDDFEKTERDRQAAAVGELPEILDALDDGYEKSLDAYKTAVQEQATYNANNTAYLQQQEVTQQQNVLAQQQEQARVLQGHNDRVRAQGVDANEMIAAENIVIAYGISPDLMTHIASKEDSPNVIRYLAANPQEGYSLATANTYEAAAKYAEIKVQA